MVKAKLIRMKVTAFIGTLRFILLGMGMACHSVSMANSDADSEQKIAKFTVQNNQVSPGFKTLFFSQKERTKIDEQRERFLKPVIAKKEEKITKEKIIKPRTLAGRPEKPRKKRIYIPPKVAISAVIIKPDGSTLIRVNDKYNTSPSKHIELNTNRASTEGVPITVNGQTQVVPVGQTLMTRKQTLVDTYKIKEQARQAAMPKTQQKAVKNRLEDVKILSGKQ